MIEIPKPGEMVYLGNSGEITCSYMHEGKDINNKKIVILEFESASKPEMSMYIAFTTKQEGIEYFESIKNTLNAVWPEGE